ncbi:PPIC-type PPIASE domain protein [uncultured Desulfatiglans sp.]|uniref:Periplasmic chaperone PpiD n=1 Tax=Uncultured Desulfatiglans sp. TaxID=1748965 RepID=A0A653A103_UNCDX|nr:PPIC-type PPIASE domain protein [uncultured Desulfatiglans sp.]
MLLSLMRKHAKSWLIKFLITIIALVFVFYFGYSFTSREGVKVAYVNGELISGLEYERAYADFVERMRAQYKDFWNEGMVEALQLKTRALEFLIQQKLLAQEAERLGFSVTKEEIQKTIMSYPAFQVDGRFDLNRYRLLLNHNRMAPEDFEAALRQDLLQEKLKQFIFAFTEVSEKELMEHFLFDNEKVKIQYAFFSPNENADVALDEKAIKEYFEKNRPRYKIPEKIKVSYLEFNPEDVKEQVTVNEADVVQYYENNAKLYTKPEEVRARHILFKVPEGASEAQEKAVADVAAKVRAQALEGVGFAKLAVMYSESETRTKGGDLGFFSKETVPLDLAVVKDMIFGLKVGEISEPVRTPSGYHILSVEERREGGLQPLDEVREKIEEILVKKTASEMAKDQALSLVDRLPYETPLTEFAAENDLSVKESDFFDSRTGLPELGPDPKRDLSTLFALQKFETSEIVEIGGKYYLFQVADRQEPRLPDFGEVEEKVKADYRAELLLDETKKRAESFLKALRDGESWDVMASKENIAVETPPAFTRRGSVIGIGHNQAFNDAAFRLSQENPYPQEVFTNERGAYVMRWEGTEPVDMELFEKDKSHLHDAVIEIKHRQAFEGWLDDLRKHAKIEIVSPVENR